MAEPYLKSLAAYSTYMTDRYQASDVSLQTYLDMIRRDPIVSFADGFVQRSVARRIGEYTDEREDVAEWVNAKVLPAVRRDMRGLQSATYYGAAIAQPRYGMVDGEMGLTELFVCHPNRWWYGRFYRNEETGEVEAVDVTGPGRVPFYNEQGARQIVHHTCGQAFGSPWGDPVARRVYTAWYIKRRLIAFEGIGLEKHGIGTAIFKTNDAADGAEYIAAWSAAGAEAAMSMQTGDEVQIVTPGWNINSPFAPVIARLDGYIFNAYGIPHLTLAEAQFGTRAQASVALEAYIMAETDTAERLADCLLNQVIEPAVAMRFGNIKTQHALPVTAASEPDREAVSRILLALGNAGAFDPRAEDQLRWVAREMEIPVDDLLALQSGGMGGPEA